VERLVRCGHRPSWQPTKLARAQRRGCPKATAGRTVGESATRP
jgi:hypothetical protein